MKTVLLMGTKKGVFRAESDLRREAWEIRGPLTSATWAMRHLAAAGETIYAGGESNWYGPAVW